LAKSQAPASAGHFLRGILDLLEALPLQTPAAAARARQLVDL
jgi:hypothetical protein